MKLKVHIRDSFTFVDKARISEKKCGHRGSVNRAKRATSSAGRVLQTDTLARCFHCGRAVVFLSRPTNPKRVACVCSRVYVCVIFSAVPNGISGPAKPPLLMSVEHFLTSSLVSTLSRTLFRPLLTRLAGAMLSRFKNAFYSVVHNLDAADAKAGGDAGGHAASGDPAKPPVKFPYTRPHFLQLHGEDEIQVSGDHAIRPIIVPRDTTKIPWSAGYAESVSSPLLLPRP